MVGETSHIQGSEGTRIGGKEGKRGRREEKANGGRNGEGETVKRAWACTQSVSSQSCYYLWAIPKILIKITNIYITVKFHTTLAIKSNPQLSIGLN